MAGTWECNKSSPNDKLRRKELPCCRAKAQLLTSTCRAKAQLLTSTCRAKAQLLTSTCRAKAQLLTCGGELNSARYCQDSPVDRQEILASVSKS